MSQKTKKKLTKTTSVQARLDIATKEAAEIVFELIGINSSQAITMFFKQVALKKALPFEVNTITTTITQQEFQNELNHQLAKGLVELESKEDGKPLFNPKDVKPFEG